MTDHLVLEDAITNGPSGPLRFRAGRVLSDDLFDVEQLRTQGIPLIEFDPLTMGPARDAFLRSRGSQSKPSAFHGAVPLLLAARAVRPGEVIAFGNRKIASTTTTRFLDPWFESGTAPTAAQPFPLARDGRLRNLLVRHQGSGNGNPVVYTVLLNGAPTILTLSVPTVAPITMMDSVSIVAALKEDTLTIEVAKAAGIGGSPGPVFCSMEFI